MNVVVFSFMIAAVFCAVIYFAFSGFLHTYPGMDGYMTGIDNQFNNAITAADMFFPVIFIVMAIMSIAAASQIQANPIYFFVMLFLNLILVLLVSVFTDFFNAILNIATTQFGISATLLVWTPLFIQYLPKINVIVMLLIALVQYGKNVFR